MSEASNSNEFYRYGYQGQYSEKDETGWNTFKLRMYDPAIGRWLGVDPMRQFYSGYVGMGNNPVSGVDPDGGQVTPPSTHTDKDGNVVAVYNDGDNGVYQHNMSYADTKAHLATNYSSSNTSAGGNLMGYTLFWDEFMGIDKNTNAYTEPVGKIHYGTSWEPIINNLHKESNGMNLFDLKTASSDNGIFDIKNDPNYAPDGMYTGKLVGNYYFSARSAGNFLAGFNARSSRIFGIFGLDLTGYMKLAGYYNVYGKLPYNTAIDLLSKGSSGAGPAPYYGENPYSGRMIIRGWYNMR